MPNAFILDLLMPLFIIAVISLLLFVVTESEVALYSGLIISVGLCVYAELVPFWVITLLMIYVGILLYQNLRPETNM